MILNGKFLNPLVLYARERQGHLNLTSYLQHCASRSSQGKGENRRSGIQTRKRKMKWALSSTDRSFCAENLKDSTKQTTKTSKST